MIPSDHFVYFYNEVFKFLREQGPDALEAYYARVADRQADFALEAFRRDGLKGMYDYWSRIRVEENCGMDLELTDDCFRLRMTACPSLAKALDSDAGACPVYCDHCPGWCLRVFTKAGYWGVYDLVARDRPVCEIWVYADAARARRKFDALAAVRGAGLVQTNLALSKAAVSKPSRGRRWNSDPANVGRAGVPPPAVDSGGSGIATKGN